MDPIVIVGSGLAGYTVAREIRRRDKRAPVAVVTADGGEYYSKPALSNALANGQDAAALVLNTAEEMARSLRAQVHARCPVTAIDRQARRIVWPGGSLAYSRLVLALGATPAKPALAGDAAGDVLSVNCLDDYAAFRERIAHARDIAILGAGLVGCEFANDLAASGYAVRVLELAPQALPRLLRADEAAILAGKLAAIGIRFHFGARVARVDRVGDRLRVVIEQGEAVEADVVLSATGLAPRLGLARDAGLATARGIVVDRFLRTSDADIYALGDCAEVDGEFLPYTEPIRHAARALGATLAGTPTEVAYPPMPVELKTPAHPLVIGAPNRAVA